jgi:hypothetical protein
VAASFGQQKQGEGKVDQILCCSVMLVFLRLLSFDSFFHLPTGRSNKVNERLIGFAKLCWLQLVLGFHRKG